ncbi:hypothetical protein [Pontibacillus yanchengensis]|uniref:Cytosolic protein n=1 Tax=Pontibacillus yanchengensis Y32 TaxID=1385514 RepID=A0A0A2TCC8_9BACI|nr:hypothetical protein [Pontibacillus yanchengensis]KGP71726.1 hypothetical protein N782_16875 [Pontibacillus yanchengensis Y32]
MKIKQFFSTYFTNHAETDETHHNDSLRTHYFKTTKDKAINVLHDMYSKSPSFEVRSVSEERGELSVQLKKQKKAFIVISVIMVKPYHTAIDFSVTSETTLPFDFGYSHKVIRQQYDMLKKELPFIETSMAHKLNV